MSLKQIIIVLEVPSGTIHPKKGQNSVKHLQSCVFVIAVIKRGLNEGLGA